jgi:4-hydroxy-2-oxoheptanedioate aldolase
MDAIINQQSQGNPILGAMVSELYSPNIPQLYQAAGLDFCIIDCEHGPFDLTMLAAMIAAGRDIAIDVLVRVPDLSRSFSLKMLDMGAAGLVFPMMSTPDMVERAVALTKYAPSGNRGLSITRAHSRYRIANLLEYHRETNSRTLLFAQIETKEGLENCAEMAAVPGLNGLLLGPGDLSMDLGITGQNDHPLIDGAAASVATACRDQGILAGVITGNFPLIARCREHGMQMVSWNSEVGMILRAAKQARGQILSGKMPP